MAKAIKLTNAYNQVVAIVDNATQALKAVEKYSECSLVTTLKTLNKDLKENNNGLIFNCLDNVIYADIITGTTKDLQREKQYINAMNTAALFK